MGSVDWGADSDPASYQRFPPTETEDPSDLPAVRAASDHGYEVAPEAPMWTFLPAVWPPSTRTWIPDTRVRHMQVSCADGAIRVLPWSTTDYFEMESDANRTLAECGLPSRPAGRLWLLKPPPGQPSLLHTLSALVASARRAGLQVRWSCEFVKHVQRELPAMFADGSLGTNELRRGHAALRATMPMRGHARISRQPSPRMACLRCH